LILDDQAAMSFEPSSSFLMVRLADLCNYVLVLILFLHHFN
jgi:hypothetical protein